MRSLVGNGAGDDSRGGLASLGGLARGARPPAARQAQLLGVVSLGDAWACVNPATGRGMSLGLAHAAVLRRVVRECGERPVELIAAFAAATELELAPWYHATVAADRTRLAEVDALRLGLAPPPAANPLVDALPSAMARDPEVFRAGLEILACLALPQEVFARPGLAQKVLENAGDGPRPAMGPDRQQLLTLLR
jgi:flavin-dependent dehydrogenase